jgi:hypothetical protein
MEPLLHNTVSSVSSCDVSDCYLGSQRSEALGLQGHGPMKWLFIRTTETGNVYTKMPAGLPTHTDHLQKLIYLCRIFTKLRRTERNTNECGLVVRVLATDPDIWVRFSALPDFLRSSGSGTGSTQIREYN